MSGAPDAAGDSPLRGVTVVITRPRSQAAELAALLRALGAEPVLVPLIEIVEASDNGAGLNRAIAELEAFDWLVVSSVNGARRVRTALVASPGGTEPGIRIAAVGRATAQALMPRIADLVPRRQSAAGLLAEFPMGAGRVLVIEPEVPGHTVSSELASGLSALGWEVSVAYAYRTIERPPSAAERRAALGG